MDRRPGVRKQRDSGAAVLAVDQASHVWSTWVQSVESLNSSRERRFRDEARDILWPVLGLFKRATVVDVGCGSGAVTRALARWLGPGCVVYGVDRDANFIAYARRQARAMGLSRRTRYLQGDALALPLPDNCADVVTSYTVVSHIPDTKRFIREKIRVCRPGGRVSIMEVHGGGRSAPPPRSLRPTRRETELWKPLEEAFQAKVERPWKIGATRVEYTKMPALLEEHGLKDIMLDAFAVTECLDDARVSREDARERLIAEERWLLTQVEQCAGLVTMPLARGHVAALKRCIRSRFAKRYRRLDEDSHTWDFDVSTTIIVSGVKPR